MKQKRITLLHGPSATMQAKENTITHVINYLKILKRLKAMKDLSPGKLMKQNEEVSLYEQRPRTFKMVHANAMQMQIVNFPVQLKT